MRQRDGSPRKAVIGTAMYAMYGGSNPYPGLDRRLAELAELIDGMARLAGEQYGRGLDLAVLPEVAVNGGLNGSAAQISVPLRGAVLERMGEVARRHRCYVVVPLFLREEDGDRCSNACALVDRQGELAGIYRKVFPVSSYDHALLEGGVTPGTEFPVFSCDFGELGIQICFDIEYELGWRALAAAGAEIVAFPTQTPQTVQPASYARRFGYYLVTSTWRNNATIFEPNGMVAARIREPARLLVHLVDLSYAIIPWQPSLGNGAAFTRAYGDRVGFHYSEEEDAGIFWSNDPGKPIAEMVRELGMESPQQVVARNRALQDALRPAPLPALAPHPAVSQRVR